MIRGEEEQNERREEGEVEKKEEERWRRRVGGEMEEWEQGYTEGEFEATFDFDSYSRSVDQRQVSDRSKRRPENGKT